MHRVTPCETVSQPGAVNGELRPGQEVPEVVCVPFGGGAPQLSSVLKRLLDLKQ